MKKIFQLLCFLCISAVVNAGVMESFDYAAGDLTDQNGGTGWSSTWRNSYSRNGNNYIVGGTGLSSDLIPTSGNASFSAGDGTRYQRDLDTMYDSGTVYVSFLMSCSDASEDPYSAVELQSGIDADAGRVFQLGILRKDDGLDTGNTEFYASVRDGVGGGRLNSVKIADFDTNVNLFIVRFDLDADIAAVYFNPDKSIDLTNGGIGLGLYDGISFDRVGLANFVGNNATSIDEIYVGTDVPVVVPEPATILMLVMGSSCVYRKKQ